MLVSELDSTLNARLEMAQISDWSVELLLEPLIRGPLENDQERVCELFRRRSGSPSGRSVLSSTTRREHRVPAREQLKTKRPGTASRASFVDHRFPDAFGFENKFNGFADRSVASEGFRNIMRGLFYLGDGIAHSNGQSSATH